MVQAQPSVKHHSSGDLWLGLLCPHEEEKLCKTVDIYILYHSSMERVKVARYSTGMVPKDVNVSDLTATSTITCSNSIIHHNAQFQEHKHNTDQHTLLCYTSGDFLPLFAPCCFSLLTLLLCSVRSTFLSSFYLC